MAGRGSVIKTIMAAAVFIAMEIAALSMLSRDGVSQHFFLSKEKHAVAGGLWRIGTSAKEYFSLKKTNGELSRENARLFEELNRYKSAERMAGLDSLIAFGERSDGFRYTPATIVKISWGKQHNYLILGQGTDEGVSARSGIITPKGVVGIVDTVSRHYAYAVSLMNADLNISARLGRNGAVGPLAWDGNTSTGAVLKEIPLQSRFEEGDTVYTSGFSSIFPPDIPLGRVKEAKVVNGATYDIKVQLFQGFNDLRYVIVATNTEREEIEELERMKSEKGGKRQ